MNTPAYHEHRYTDRMVRNNPDLVTIAYNYIRTYTGDFEFLLNLQAIVAEGGVLGVNHIRGILNCMRGDRHAYQLLPTTSNPAPQEVKTTRPGHLRVVRDDPFELPEERQKEIQRYPKKLRHTFKMKYLLSTAPTAYVAHLLRTPEFTTPRGTGVSWFDWRNAELGTVWLHAWCGYHVVQHEHQRNGRYGYPTKLGARMSDDTDDRHECGTCVKKRIEYREKYGR